MAQRRSGNSHTTISVTWADKDEFRRFAKEVKKTKHGIMYESDAVLFKKMLDFYEENHADKNDFIPQTYPNKTFPNVDQPSSNLVEPISN